MRFKDNPSLQMKIDGPFQDDRPICHSGEQLYVNEPELRWHGLNHVPHGAWIGTSAGAVRRNIVTMAV